MGLFDKLRKPKQQVGETVAEHEAKIDGAIDKAAEVADDKTGGKHTDKIEGAAEQAKGIVDKLADGD